MNLNFDRQVFLRITKNLKLQLYLYIRNNLADNNKI